MRGRRGVSVEGFRGAHVGVAQPFAGPGGAVAAVDLAAEELPEFVGGFRPADRIPAYAPHPGREGAPDEIVPGGLAGAGQDVYGIGLVCLEPGPRFVGDGYRMGAAFGGPVAPALETQEMPPGILEEPGPLQVFAFAGAQAHGGGEEVAGVEPGVVLLGAEEGGAGFGGGYQGFRRAFVGFHDAFGVGALAEGLDGGPVESRVFAVILHGP